MACDIKTCFQKMSWNICIFFFLPFYQLYYQLSSKLILWWRLCFVDLTQKCRHNFGHNQKWKAKVPPFTFSVYRRWFWRGQQTWWKLCMGCHTIIRWGSIEHNDTSILKHSSLRASLSIHAYTCICAYNLCRCVFM